MFHEDNDDKIDVLLRFNFSKYPSISIGSGLYMVYVLCVCVCRNVFLLEYENVFGLLCNVCIVFYGSG